MSLARSRAASGEGDTMNKVRTAKVATVDELKAKVDSTSIDSSARPLRSATSRPPFIAWSAAKCSALSSCCDE